MTGAAIGSFADGFNEAVARGLGLSKSASIRAAWKAIPLPLRLAVPTALAAHSFGRGLVKGQVDKRRAEEADRKRELAAQGVIT
jgi:hypothetical protein